MRDILFRHLTSENKRKRVIVTSEVADKQGIHSVIRRHFICIVKEVREEEPGAMQKPLPYLYVLKEHDTQRQKEKFLYRIKGSVYAIANKKVFLVLFAHSLKISLNAIAKDAVRH